MKIIDTPLVKKVREAYRSGQEDEALEPIVVVDRSGSPVGRMENGDYVIFYNIRGEREIELTECLTAKEFPHFPRKDKTLLNFVTMIEYSSSLDVKVAFPPENEIKNTLSEVLSNAGIRFVKVAESEKAVHIGYFMNGKNENPFQGEERIIVPSPEGIASYAEAPDMSADQVTDQVIEKLQDRSCRFIVANLANVDVVGHIEDREAVFAAVRSVDIQLGRIREACCKNNVTLLITADHGTAEDWLYPDGTINTGHTKSPVPFIIADFASEEPAGLALNDKGELSDIAPTILELLSMDKPSEMTGNSLISCADDPGDLQRRVCLLILDGWGMGGDTEGNMIIQAGAPGFDKLWEEFPHSQLDASGEAVGMPAGTVGNSEAGHLHIGAGRRIFLDRVRIDRAIEDRTFFSNKAFVWAMDRAREKKVALHLLGIVSHYSSHGTIDHLFSLLKLARNMEIKSIFVHSLIGRRGERPESGAIYVSQVEEMCREIGVGTVVTVMGRYWALDREENWHLVDKAYRALVFGDGTQVIV